MSDLVIDASIAIKWFFDEDYSDRARALLMDRRHALVAPDLIHVEVGNVLWKRVTRGELTAPMAIEIASTLIAMPIECVPSTGLLTSAVELACRSQRTAYDSLYIVLAIQRGGVMVTADERLANAVRVGSLAPYVQWIGDYTESL